jgi:hypothetical protein
VDENMPAHGAEHPAAAAGAPATGVHAAAAEAVAALRSCLDGEDSAAVQLALASLGRLCDADADGDAQLQRDRLAHACALMDAGAPSALAQLLKLADQTSSSPNLALSARTDVLRAVFSALRALFSSAARLRARDPAVRERAFAALCAFDSKQGVAFAAFLLSDHARAAAAAPLEALMAVLRFARMLLTR